MFTIITTTRHRNQWKPAQTFTKRRKQARMLLVVAHHRLPTPITVSIQQLFAALEQVLGFGMNSFIFQICRDEII